MKKDANLPLTTNKGFVTYRRLPITYFGKGLVIEPHLRSISAIWDLKAGVEDILYVERLTRISQNCLQVE